MSEVVFVPAGELARLPDALRLFNLGRFRGETIPVKLHMGERGNKWYVEPGIVKLVCDELSRAGAKPFLFDTLPCYEGGRDTKEKYLETARMNGFWGLGHPIIIGNEGVNVELGGHSFEVAEELYRSKGVVAISHAKGHTITALGAAIKNLGMGGLSDRSKRYIHDGGKPVIDRSKCDLCGTCEALCPSDETYGEKAICIGEDWVIDYGACLGCGRCVRGCPREALSYKVDDFNRLLALGAKACLIGKEALYINVALKITKYCDCAVDALPIICEDIGILVSNDPVAIDAASVDLIEGRMGKSFKEVFGIDAMDHIRFAEEVGLGSAEYRLISIPR
ncbi:MAG: DUF362 domain-containing protein [Candidatus Bathyarchaeia archaeon]